MRNLGGEWGWGSELLGAWPTVLDDERRERVVRGVGPADGTDHP